MFSISSFFFAFSYDGRSLKENAPSMFKTRAPSFKKLGGARSFKEQ